jgi:LDH2 family malate/lactate/ureidoglycolate dehydrogenase
MLSGAAFGSKVGHMYENVGSPQDVGHLFGVLPIVSFEDLGTYHRRMDAAVHDLTGVRKAPGVDRIYMPGEREHLAMQRNASSGIPLNSVTFEELVALGKGHGVELRPLADETA